MPQEERPPEPPKLIPPAPPPSSRRSTRPSRRSAARLSSGVAASMSAAIVGGGVAAMLYEKLGSWDVVFYGGAVLAVVSAVIAYLLSKMPAPRIPAPVEEFGGVPGAAQG